MNINDLKKKTITELINIAKELRVTDTARIKKQEIIFAILNERAKRGESIYGCGILEILHDGFGFLRSADSYYLAGPDDIYVSPNQIKKFRLRTGDEISGKIRPPKSSEKYFALLKISEINSDMPEAIKSKVFFENLTPIHACDKFLLELGNGSADDITSRVVDIIAPLGKGQRALLVSPPKAGKTIMLQNLASSLIINHKESVLIVLLIDERPEEVTEMVRSVKGEVIASTFDEPAARHIQVAEMVMERAKRLVEHKKDVIILLDSITRLARAYNAIAPSSGKVLTGGVDSNALQRPKRFFGAARNVEEGGSLTIIATALVETGSKMDDIIFEEFKGTGNAEIYLDRKISEKRIYPAINIIRSGTRREELLIDSNYLQKAWLLRKVLHSMEESESMKFLTKHLRDSKTNELFFESMKAKTS